jgi:hypothetical protein
MSRTLLAIEVVGFFGSVLFGVLWYLNPGGNWDPLFALCGLTSLCVELVRRLWGKSRYLRFPSNGAKIQHREAMRKVFQEEIYRCRAEKLREDVIVRNVDRLDSYPNIDEKERGISPWFRVGLVDTYERGIVLCLGIGGLKECEGGYRYVDHANEEKSDRTALLMADVPYESIEAVNMEGDNFYNYPHIYCYFDFAGEPYERKWFAEQIDLPHGHPYFKKIAEHADIARNNPTEGPLYFA